MSKNIFVIIFFLTLCGCSSQLDCDKTIKIDTVEGDPDTMGSYYGSLSYCLGLTIENRQNKKLQLNLDSLIYFKNSGGEKQYLRKSFASNSEIEVSPNRKGASCLFLEPQFDMDKYKFYEFLNAETFYIERGGIEKELCWK